MLKIITSVLPFLFILHDVEEMIEIRLWLDDNKHKIPDIAGNNQLKQLLLQSFDISISEFKFAIITEFIIFSSISFFSTRNPNNTILLNLFIAMTGVFTFHTIAHLIQLINLKKQSIRIILVNLIVLITSLYYYYELVQSQTSSTIHISIVVALGCLLLSPALVAAQWMWNLINQ